VNVTDSSLGKMICQLRQALDSGQPEPPMSPPLLALNRAWTEGRAALDTLDGSQLAGDHFLTPVQYMSLGSQPSTSTWTVVCVI
jgi:hypothetical protein